MAIIEYTVEDNVAILTLNNGENRFSFEFFNTFHETLEKIEKETEANVLVITSSDDKIWSNGIDLEWMMENIQKDGIEFRRKFTKELFRFYEKLLVYPMITIAAINGHAFAGGAILACTCDLRYMRNDRGWFCFPEVDIKIPFQPFLNALVAKAIPMNTLVELQFTGKRITARECEKVQMIQKACVLDELMPEVMAYAKAQNKDRKTLRIMKTMLYSGVLKVLEENPDLILHD